MTSAEVLEFRFWSKVDFDAHDEHRCWSWLGGTVTRGGYGQFSLCRVNVLAHRLSYEMERGPIQAGLDLDHLCRNRICVNPWHLEPVSARENALRGVGPTAKNALKVACPKGHSYDVHEVEVSGATRRRCSMCARENGRRRQKRYRERQASNR
jgi:hypothetical protein